MMKAIQHLWRAFFYSVDGIKASWKDELAFRIETTIVAFLAPVACFITEDTMERGLLIGCLLLVLMAELMNSAIEAVVDRIGPEIHPLSKKAKDCGSAAVLFAALVAGVVWLGVLFS